MARAVQRVVGEKTKKLAFADIRLSASAAEELKSTAPLRDAGAPLGAAQSELPRAPGTIADEAPAAHSVRITGVSPTTTKPEDARLPPAKPEAHRRGPARSRAAQPGSQNGQRSRGPSGSPAPSSTPSVVCDTGKQLW